jgi:hypothetical protein
MPYKHISQKEARWYLKRATTSENKLKALSCRWATSYPGAGIGNVSWPAVATKISVAVACGRAVVARAEGDVVKFYAVDF